MNESDRFWTKVQITDGCWLWTGCLNRGGYGHFNAGPGKTKISHRFAYEQVVGSIPEELELDHLCRVRHCVNPAHLEPVTRAENLRRGRRRDPDFDPPIAQRQRAKTHCPQDHEYTPENTYVLPSRPTARYCRACKNDRRRAAGAV